MEERTPPVSFYDDLQHEAAAWGGHNFPHRTPEQALLGIVEELGELAEARERQDREAVLDAVGDVMVFLCDYCTQQGFVLSELVARAGCPPEDGYNALGRLAKAHLKLVQKVRGTPATLRADARAALVVIISEMEWAAEVYVEKLEDVVRAVWAKVRERDWVAFPFDGRTR